jgi:PAS domain-containing protein
MNKKNRLRSNNKGSILAPDKVNFRNLKTLDNSNTGIALINYQWVYLYINKSYARQMQLNGDNIIGLTFFELIPEAGTGCFFTHVCRHVMNKRTPLEVETRYKLIGKPDCWASVRVAPVPEGILIKLKDTTIRQL